MSQLLVPLLLAPAVPVCCLALLLWLDRLEETLNRDIQRRSAQASTRQLQSEKSPARLNTPIQTPVSG